MTYEPDFKRRVYNDEEFLNNITKLAFQKVDKDNSGEIDIDEFTSLIVDIAKKGDIEAPSDEEIRRIFDILDKDKGGSIGLEEFRFLILRILDMD